MNPIGKGLMVATAVAALVVGGDLVAQAQTKAGGDAVKCTGINECKGKGSCKSAMNDCKGKNECKGKSFMETKSAAECTQKGGKVAAATK
jgi:hypothetical protein